MVNTALRTDIGRVRAVNEDRALVVTEPDGLVVAVVADGMGGHQAGDTASQMAVEHIRGGLQALHAGMEADAYEAALRKAVDEANRRIYELASAREQFQGMGTTVVCVLAGAERLTVGHIGDSRVYLCRGNSLIQLTEDHSLVNELIKSGQLTLEEAEHHPRRKVITRALGTDITVEPDVRHFEWNPGDKVLLCSDGLSGLVGAAQICAILLEDDDLDRTADRLIQTALEAGGDDNITVVLLENRARDHDSDGEE